MSDPTVTPLDDAQAASTPNSALQVGGDEGEEFDKERALSTIRKLRDFEKLAKQQLREFAELKRTQTDADTAKLGEVERLRKQFEAMQEQHGKAAAELKVRRTADAVRQTARDLNLDAELAAELLTPEKIAYDDEGEPQGVRDALKKLAVKFPQLGAPQARTANPARGASGVEESDAARRARLNGGTGLNIFDPATAAQFGGGVIFPEKD